MPEYGMGFDVRFDEPPAIVDPFVETEDWSQPRVVRASTEPVHFIDGVRRIELRLLADVDGRRVAGLFGTYAVGSACCEGKATFEDSVIGRCIVLGGGEKTEPINVRIGASTLKFEAVSTPGSEPDDPLLKLQSLMRQSEAELGARVAAADTDLVLVDGPLAFELFGETRGPIVGVIKRFGRVYLNPSESQLIAKLTPNERTPLFAIAGESDRRRRYAWYTRLAPLRLPWHDHAGVVRCEVRGAIAVADAAALADRVAGLLPSFSGRASDPRTPQNLVPIAGLETWLRHRVGDTRLIRRALLERIAVGEAA